MWLQLDRCGLFTGDVSVEKVALVLCYHGKQTLSAQRSGLLLRRCLQRCVTRQLGNSGDYGGCISKPQGTTYLLFLHSWFFIHIFTHVREFAKRLFLDRKTALIWWLLVAAESLPYSPVMFESVIMEFEPRRWSCVRKTQMWTLLT